MSKIYNVTALQMTIYFNKEGDHDHNGLLFALDDNLPILRYIQAILKKGSNDPNPGPDPNTYYEDAKARAKIIGVSIPEGTEEERFKMARQPHPLVRPLVLRCNKGDTMVVNLTNKINEHENDEDERVKRWIGLHLVSDGYGIESDDGSHIGGNEPSLLSPNESKKYTWVCKNEGVFPFHDGGNYSGGEDGTNVHGLFGALIVEPEGTIWRDPVTGRTSMEGDLDGLYLDIITDPKTPYHPQKTSDTELPTHIFPPPQAYHDFKKESHREFVIFFQDEPEFDNHLKKRKSPCDGCGFEDPDHDHDHKLPIMPVSYRAEPMINRERILWDLICTGHELERPVHNEEQHHSSWMFGDPETPILKAYIGDPVRIRFVHAAVKETHVFHLHLYEWHAVPSDINSPRIDAISVSPQTAHTIEPVWGAGNRHQVAGDVIWHCHLYPHFHEGMWGMFRTFETLQEGVDGDFLESNDSVYKGRRIGRYPSVYENETDPEIRKKIPRIETLLPLPDRPLPPKPTASHPGYPLYIPGKMQQKSPIPPWPGDPNDMDPLLNYRSTPSNLEQNAFNHEPVPGELFTRNPFKKGQEIQWNRIPDYPNDPVPAPDFELNGEREKHYDVVVKMMKINYNEYGWHDKDGHLYYLEKFSNPKEEDIKEPLFFRALHGQILNLTLTNKLEPTIPETDFDLRFPHCPELPWEGECAMHVHMVKFDPICADGASTGWNYMSGPVLGKKMVYRWWLDKEFGTIFFHDHLFANYRQKHGLFGALIVEPVGSKFYHPKRNEEIISGLQARIKTTQSIEDKAELVEISPTTWAREFCIAIADFIPMWNGNDKPLNEPDKPGGHGDQGIMALNYRCDPIPERMKLKNSGGHVDPSKWFTSLDPYNRDPYTTLFQTYRDDPLWFRVIQGSHEEQHSFQVHDMRWQRFRGNNSRDSPIRNQQTFGISEAFTFVNHEAYTAGDYMYKLSGADDLWLGCWGLIRAFPRILPLEEADGLLHLSDSGNRMDSTPDVQLPNSIDSDEENEVYDDTQIPPDRKIRHFRITVRRESIVYREQDLIDLFGLVYTIDSITYPDGEVFKPHPVKITEPLVLRCREDEYVRVTLRNNIPEDVILTPEPRAPQVPVEDKKSTTNPYIYIPNRPVSSKVSMHADLVKYDVRTSDGANVGRNPGRRKRGQAVNPSKGYYYYEWDTRRRPEAANEGEPLGPVLLQDMADFRNHRHHGLIGALIIEHKDATPYFVANGEATAGPDAQEAWHGTRVTVVRTKPDLPDEDKRAEEAVLLMQDGLRLYLNGDTNSLEPPDEPPSHGEDDTDHEDQGQKGFNYRSEPVGPIFDPDYASQPPHEWLANPSPATPVFHVPVNVKVRLHLLGALDKPRNQSFTVHGVTWKEWRYLSDDKVFKVASESAITCGSSRIFEFIPEHKGDYAYRSGVLKWAVPQGLWGIIRVISAGNQNPPSAKPLPQY